MSTDIIAQLKQQNGLVQTGLDEDTLAVAGGQSQGNKRISIKGGVFRKIVGGKEVAAIEDRHMNVVFVKMAHNASRTFYATQYKEGEKISPTCWSSDSRTPDADVQDKQASSCDQCPHSVKGSTTKCRLSWRTAVTLPDNPKEVLQLVLPATSAFGKEDNGKFPFRPYIQYLASNNVSASKLITKMQFDPKAPTPKILFSVAGIVPEQHAQDIETSKASKEAEQAITLTVYQTDSSADIDTSDQESENKEVSAPVEVDNSDVSEPTIRTEDKKESDSSNDVSDILNKWATKD